MVKKFGSHNMKVLYLNLFYNEVCYEENALFLKMGLDFPIYHIGNQSRLRLILLRYKKFGSRLTHVSLAPILPDIGKWWGPRSDDADILLCT